MLEIDSTILLWINGHGNEWLDTFMWTVSRSKTWLPLYVLLVGLIAYRYRNWKAVLLILVGFGIAVGLSDLTTSGFIKPLVARYRPTREPSIDPIRLVHKYIGGRYGFCSSHAANTMACGLLFSLLYRNNYATAGLMTWVAVVGYSRMYLGVHYPTDILCGWIIGALWAVLVYWALLRLWRACVASHSPLVDDAVAQRGGS